MGVHTILRAAELAREWRVPLRMAQLDLKKAFDHVDHRAAFDAMKLQGVSMHSMALIAQIWHQSVIKVKLGCVISEDVPLHRGLPQGAPESPLIFTMIVEMLVRRLEAKWRQMGLGYKIDGLWIFCICYADDLVLLAGSVAQLEVMVKDIVQAFREIGLGIGADKTHWSSTPQLEGTTLSVEGHDVLWENTITFAGTVLDLTGSSDAAIHYRMIQGMKALAKWKPLLQASWIPLARRADLLSKSVWSSLLWCAATWTTTKSMRNSIASWGARAMAATAGVRRSPAEPIDSWWRRLHREGHRLINKFIVPPVVLSRLQVHRWAGHLARMPLEQYTAQALRCRGMQWWRWRQAQHHDKWSGPHPKRFKAWRWEEQLSKPYGDGYSENSDDNTGWLLAAQNRQQWKAMEMAFARECP